MASRDVRPPSYEWVLRPVDEALCLHLSNKLNISDLSARLLYHRGARSVEDATRFLETSLAGIRSPFLFRSMEAAVERIVRAIRRRERVLVYGDYDVDGLTGTAVVVQFLRQTGLEPFVYIPDRLGQGYGFHAECVPEFRDRGVTLVLTVDCGVSALEAVVLANRLGMDVIVTDHHESVDPLPPARAILNPKLPQEDFPFRDLAGVGVAFFLVMALRSRLREIGFWRGKAEPNLKSYLDLVALGTLADMVPLRDENRIFVKFGLEEISAAKRPGVAVLKEQCGLRNEAAECRAVLYRLVPRINAPGRLGSPNEALRILLCEDLEEARRVAAAIEERNQQRKSLEDEVYREAADQARRQIDKSDAPVLVLGGEGWHRGILGIVAARLAEDFDRPVVLVSFDGDEGKGSVRTIENVEILDALESCRDLLESYGGHRLAAGIAVKRENMEAFRRVFEEALRGRIGKGRTTRKLELDLWVKEPGQLRDEVVDEFTRLAPFGSGNAEPLVGLEGVSILDRRVVGNNHLLLSLDQAGRRYEAIGFGLGGTAYLEPQSAGRWDVACTPERDDWRGRNQVRLRVVDIRPSGPAPVLGLEPKG
jgi:single-stranded-DNA-specific exonuclease